MLGLFLIWRGGIPNSVGLSQSVYGQGEAQGHGGEGADHGVLSAGPLEECGEASCPGCPVSRASGHRCGEDGVPQVHKQDDRHGSQRNRVHGDLWAQGTQSCWSTGVKAAEKSERTEALLALHGTRAG